MVWVGRDLKCQLIPNLLPWARTLPTRPGCPKIQPGLENLQEWGKCDGCNDIVLKGGIPACVEICDRKALRIVDVK